MWVNNILLWLIIGDNQNIIITGTRLDSNNTVFIGTTPCQVTLSTSTQINCTPGIY